MWTSLLLSFNQPTFVSTTFLLWIARDFALREALSHECHLVFRVVHIPEWQMWYGKHQKYSRKPPGLYFMYFILSEKVFLVKSCGLGKKCQQNALSASYLFCFTVISSLLFLQVSAIAPAELLSIITAVTKWCFCSLLDFSFCYNSMCNVSMALSSDVLDNMEAGFSLGLRHVNWGVCVWATGENQLLNSAWR